MSRIVVATDDARLRKDVLDILGPAGLPTLSVGSWSALVRHITRPGTRLVLVDAKLNRLVPGLLDALARSLPDPPELRALRGPAPPLKHAPLSGLRAVASRRVRSVLSPEERKEIRLLGMSSERLAELSSRGTRDLPILFIGERGTGKKRVARALHQMIGAGRFQSMRPTDPLKGVEAGTLFLEKIEAWDPKHLDQVLRAAGAADCRCVAACRGAVPPAAREWQRIHLPPLRTRPDDLRELTRLYIDRYRHRLGQPQRRLDRTLWGLLRSWEWPGNARELEGYVVQLLTAVPHATIRARELPPRVRALIEGGAEALEEDTRGFEDIVEARLRPLVAKVEPGVELHRLTVDATERALIRLTLARTGGNQKAAAALLGVARNTLSSKARRLGVLRPGEER